ncbi:L,D-transpeptidase family protein [Otariodibacter oris]|uniref:L,D-transpeptidase-like protein n=1 Tax=Otariodibacter oris TaxID=1032623 RepID=A0A420XHG1_9PAST|nr:L,D-transpeptidase family protein [Otariodibacter oris]QGM81015.1 L,D-transpeptidase [Otariodibacter oris]RKR76804.1 L,D-transpeptidase-like protein [Otariodibacter oris]
MKKLKYLPLVMLSSVTFSTIAIASDNVLSQLSFKVQQEKAMELARSAQSAIQQENSKIAAEQLAVAQQRVQQEIGNNQLLLLKTTAGIYLQNEFMPLWQDKMAEKLFLKEYAVFAASGISKKSTMALKQILNSNSELERDILLTDSFLDYLYYTKNVSKFANEWLYDLGSYSVKAPSNQDIELWISMIKTGYSAQFVGDLIPRNHVYQETVNKMFELLSSSSTNSNVSAQNLALNAERLRLIPSFDNGIFVNIPSYQLYYFRDGKLALQSKVIVGRTDRRTPVMYSKLSNVVVNPPWNVPTSIKNKDLVPKMRKDPGYAERNGYELFDSKGNKVDAYSIDWTSYDNPKKNFPYRIRQKAGDDSALGRYKFNMPSSDAIYLHDTPNHGLFGRSMRALSSGCVRVAKSDELAMMLLKEAGWSEQRKNKVLQSKKTTSARIQSDNPVYLYYVTAWVENGQVHTLPDIYKLDKKVSSISLDWAKLSTLI